MSLLDRLRRRKPTESDEGAPDVVSRAREHLEANQDRRAQVERSLDLIAQSSANAAAELELIREQVELLRRSDEK